MATDDLARIRKLLASLVAKKRVTSAHAVIYLHETFKIPVPGGFAYPTPSETARIVEEVAEELANELAGTP